MPIDITRPGKETNFLEIRKLTLRKQNKKNYIVAACNLIVLCAIYITLNTDSSKNELFNFQFNLLLDTSGASNED